MSITQILGEKAIFKGALKYQSLLPGGLSQGFDLTVVGKTTAVKDYFLKPQFYGFTGQQLSYLAGSFQVAALGRKLFKICSQAGGTG